MGKIQKMVWPQGKNLKPQPKGRAPVQPIPGPKPRKTPAEKRKDQEYRLALSKGDYPRDPLARSPMEVLLSPVTDYMDFQERTITTDQYELADPLEQIQPVQWVLVELRKAMEATMAISAPAPIEVTEAQYQALTELPLAKTPQELAELASMYGTAVMVVKEPSAPLEGEILPPEPMAATRCRDRADATAYAVQAMQARAAAKLRQIQEEMAMSAIWGWKLP